MDTDFRFYARVHKGVHFGSLSHGKSFHYYPQWNISIGISLIYNIIVFCVFVASYVNLEISFEI